MNCEDRGSPTIGASSGSGGVVFSYNGCGLPRRWWLFWFFGGLLVWRGGGTIGVVRRLSKGGDLTLMACAELPSLATTVVPIRVLAGSS